MLILDSIAKRYNKLPSELLDKNLYDIQFDFFCLQIGIELENQEFKKVRIK